MQLIHHIVFFNTFAKLLVAVHEFYYTVDPLNLCNFDALDKLGAMLC